jgi:hypothetical protein
MGGDPGALSPLKVLRLLSSCSLHRGALLMSLSHTAKTLLRGTPALLTGGIPGARAGQELLAINQPELYSAHEITLTSREFVSGQEIPARYSTDGLNLSPPISWANVPPDAKSLVLLVEDPDAPLPKPFVHWLAFNIGTHALKLPEGVSVEEKSLLHQGKNSSLRKGWTGMAPPKGDTRHHYHFQIFALDGLLNLQDGVGRSALLHAMNGHVLGKGELIGTFRRE